MAKSKKEIISIKSISKIYHLGTNVVKALDNVSVNIYENDFISIMGPSGSGKSTLMNIIGCLDVPTKGTYKFNKALISEMNDSQLANIRNEKIGFVFQTFNLLPKLNALQNVEVPLIYSSLNRAKRTQRAKESLKIVGLEDRMTHKPNELSGGQRQRVAIARALVNKPSIILADEPTGNLDSKSGVEIMKILDSLHEAGNTIILVTHEEYIADHADRTIHLFDGRIKEDIKTNKRKNNSS
ncbi:MAG: ABC transporter ATP-binding protein [Candidatus Neomarinimicrobiota bacterium]|nr:ABC transporter ATP-binding protein [Candidatus Neomarinimicrobiota bacterium]